MNVITCWSKNEHFESRENQFSGITVSFVVRLFRRQLYFYIHELFLFLQCLYFSVLTDNGTSLAAAWERKGKEEYHSS